MNVQLLDLILFVLFFQLLTLVPYLLTQKTNRGISNKFLAYFLIAKALCISNFLAFRLYPYTVEYFPHAFYFGSSFSILWGPLLFLYVKSYTKPSFKISQFDLLHFAPFAIHLIWFTINFHLNNADTKREIIQANNLLSSQFWGVYHYALSTYTLLYTAAALGVIKAFHSNIREHFSNISAVNLNWLTFIVLGFLLKVFFDFWFQSAEWASTSSTIALYMSRLTLFLFINILIFKGLKQPSIWNGEFVLSKAKKLSLSKDRKEKHLEHVIAYVENQKPYLNPDITLEDLAKEVDIAPRTLSMILNECCNQNFYDFINSYRVKESEKLLKEPNSQFKTVLEVLFEVGFNSKSSFNTAFKKYTGMTPTQFKKMKSV